MTIDARTRDLLDCSDAMHEEKLPLHTLWQECADQFYPERADFTTIRSDQSEFADHLHNSFPIFARRELGDAISSMLRPRGKEWFRFQLRRDELMERPDVKAWCDKVTKTMGRMIYDPAALFVRATKMGDHDWATIGNAVLSVEDVPDRSQLLFMCWHPRDVAWAENHLGQVDRVDRKCKMTLRAINQKWPGKLPEKLNTMLRDKPSERLEVRHIVLPRDDFERSQPDDKPKRKKVPFVEIYALPDEQCLLAENDLKFNPYVIPRWHLTGASPYAYSPAAMVALPDARQSQALALMIREAGEKMIDPPMVAVKEALRSDLSLMAGTVTWIDAEYDERMGQAVRPIQDVGDMPAGFQMLDQLHASLNQAFMLNKLNLPTTRDMTATEINRRYEEYIRAAVPLFEPLEHEYNAPLLDLAAQIAIDVGAFGRPETWPDEVRGQDFEFSFENAIQQAKRERASSAFVAGIQLITAAKALDPQAGTGANVGKALDAALEGSGWDTDWRLSENEEKDAQEAAGEEAALGKALMIAQQAAPAARDMGQAAKAMTEAGAMEAAA